MNLTDRIALVASTWTPRQQLHPGNVAWHGAGCDGAPPADVTLEGDDWFAEAWLSTDEADGSGSVEIDGHFSPRLGEVERHDAFEQLRALAPRGEVSLVSDAAMAATARACGAGDVEAPYFLLQHRSLTDLPAPRLPEGYELVTAEVAGEEARVLAHHLAWAPARIKGLLGLPVTGDEPTSSFSTVKHRAMRDVGIYRPELDLMLLAPDGTPAALALGWLDVDSRSMLFEPVGTSPDHARRGLSFVLCAALMREARRLGATQAVVGPRGDDAYPVPRRLYESLGFTTLARTTALGRTTMLAWSPS